MPVHVARAGEEIGERCAPMRSARRSPRGPHRVTATHRVRHRQDSLAPNCSAAFEFEVTARNWCTEAPGAASVRHRFLRREGRGDDTSASRPVRRRRARVKFHRGDVWRRSARPWRRPRRRRQQAAGRGRSPRCRDSRLAGRFFFLPYFSAQGQKIRPGNPRPRTVYASRRGSQCC